jgi:acetyl-CoA acetyltransferase
MYRLDGRRIAMRGKVAVAGVGETTQYRHGRSPDPEFRLALDAILNACRHAGISPREIDGFSSYSSDRNEATRLAAALGLDEVRFASMQWGGGGGGAAGGVANAAGAIVSGQAGCVVVFRALAQGQFERFGLFMGGARAAGEKAYTQPHGLLSAAHLFAMRVRRFMEEHGVRQEALRAIALAAYHHAQSNPRAVMYGKPLDAQRYDESRWISEPFHLFDCCLETDGAAALILVSAERARDLPNPLCHLLSAGSSIPYRSTAMGHNAPGYATSNIGPLARRLFTQAGVTPADVDVLQNYENFTGGVVMSIVEMGFCAVEEVNDFFREENLIVGGRLPLNTSGGNLAEAYIHGLGHLLEGARQIFGQSTAQVDGADVSMVASAPMVAPLSGCIFGSEAVL